MLPSSASWSCSVQDQHRSILGRRKPEHTGGVEDMGCPSHETRTDSDTFCWFCMCKIIKAKKKLTCLRAGLFLQTPILFPAGRWIRQRCSFRGEGANGVIHHKKTESLLGIFGLLRWCLHVSSIYCSCSSWMCSMSTQFSVKRSVLLSVWCVFHPSRALSRVCLAAF